MKNSDILSEEIKEKDEECLKAVTSIQYKKSEGGYDYEIIFTFKDNDHFTNKELKVKFFMDDE